MVASDVSTNGVAAVTSTVVVEPAGSNRKATVEAVVTVTTTLAVSLFNPAAVAITL